MVSVVITTCKRSWKIVLRAVDSVLAQTYKDIELFVVDDSPNSYELRQEVANQLNRYMECDPRLHYIQHEKCKGACAARNTGLALAKGTYIAFLDDDDEWLPNKLEKQLEVFAKGDVNLAVVYCQYLYFYESRQEEMIPYRNFKSFQRGMIFDTLIFQNYVASTSFPLIKTASLREVGGFDELMLSCQDYDVWLRLAERYAFDYVEEPLVRYHIHPAESIGKNPQKRVRGQERLNEKNKVYLATHREAAWARYLILVRMYAENKELHRSMKTWCMAVKKGPAHIVKNMSVLLKVGKTLVLRGRNK